jgi:outer membrane protein assembly factor BamB
VLTLLRFALALAPSNTPGPAAAIPPADVRGAQQEPEGDEASRPFRIPDHAAAKARMDRAAEHVAAARWREALQELQGVLEEHRGDLLADERPRSRGGQPSLQPVHAGAGPRAREVLLHLPPEARALYRERHGAEASAAFGRARERADRSALAEVARRWPLTDAARAAWWALGDLELERGEEDKARSAWSRAVASLLGQDETELARANDWAQAERSIGELPESPERAGALRRAALARASLEALESGSPSSVAVPFADALHPFTVGPGLGLSPGSTRLSGRDLEGWQEPFVLPPHPFKRADSLFPARSGDVLLVTTSLRLMALHAWSGALLWDSGEPEGWNSLSGQNRSKFLNGIDANAALVAPAAGGHVALAALQIPVTFVQDFVYAGNIPVTKIIPDRRLFAFDLESGRPLWNHEPPENWDGESGSFAQRMSVAGPPILCGTRVLAPFYRMQGRIDYHVGCFDLETGALLWSTALISGQRELNMFGRAEHEFCAPPLVVHGDRVIALTQLGTVAALDLFTGEILWETLYDQVPLPKSLHGGFTATPRVVNWSNAPPVVAEGVVVATPIDSESMVGIDLATGGLLWSLDHRRIEVLFDRNDIHLLVGARPGLVFVSGQVLGAIAARSGLRISAPSAARWMFTDDGLRDRMYWRPVLAGDRIVLPLRESRVEVDVETGREVSNQAWDPPQSGGNLVIGPGEMSTVSSDGVTGWFDWDLLTQKARAALAASPDDPALALALGRLLADRGGSLWQRGNLEQARTHLDEAESVLARALAARTAPTPGGEDGPMAGPTPAAEEMHRVLRSQARLRAGLADRSGALAALRRARPLAPDPGMLRDTILEEIALLRGTEPDASPARAEAIATLERECADLPIVCDAVRGEGSEPAAPSILPRFLPIVGSVVKTDAVYCEMPVGLWVILDRVADAAAQRDARSELIGLHAVLEHYPDVDLPSGPSGQLAAERIGTILSEGGRENRKDGYEVFEARAGKLLETALAAGDQDGLARVGQLFPHSRAAEQAAEHRLDRAFEAGDTAQVAKIVQEGVPPAPLEPGARGFSLADADERQVRGWLRLSATLAKSGNGDLADELLRCLAESHPDLRTNVENAGEKTLAELAAELPRRTEPDPAPAIGRFGPMSGDRKDVQRIVGDWEILGRLPTAPGAAEAETEVFAAARIPTRSPVGSGQGVALVSAIVGRPSEGVDLDLAFQEVLVNVPGLSKGAGAWSHRSALAPDRILLRTSEGAAAIDGRGGRAWEWKADAIGSTPLSILCTSGVAVVSVDRGGGRYYLQALDAHSGIELWRTPLLDPDLVPTPLATPRRIVLLPAQMHREGRVLDLFTGRETATFTFDTPARGPATDEAWIEGDRLIVPWFENSRDPDGNHVLAFDLATGNRLWRVAFGDEDGSRRTIPGGPAGTERRADSRELVAVLQRPGRTWLLVRSLPQPGERFAAGGPAAAMTMVELSTRIGALSPLPNVRVGPTDSVLGLPRAGRLALSSTIVFLLGHKEGSNEARLRAVDLERGELWTTVLLPSFEDLVQARVPGTSLPQPALSDSAVVVAYSLDPKQGVSSARESAVECLDRANGRRISYFSLSAAMGRCDSLKLYPFGSALLVQGEHGLEVLR